MSSEEGTTDAVAAFPDRYDPEVRDLYAAEDRGPELQGDDLDVHHEEADTVGLEEILYQYREVILDLAGRVLDLEKAMRDRPVFAQTVRGRRTGH